jgi:hypothetical protein
VAAASDNPVDLELPASDERTGICAGWQAGVALATWMEDGPGIAPSPTYPVGRAAPAEER